MYLLSQRLTLLQTAAAAPTTEPLQLILAPTEQEDSLEALLNCVSRHHPNTYPLHQKLTPTQLPVQALLAEQVEAAEKERPAKRGRGRPKGKKPKEAPVTYRCRYGCLKRMVGGHALRKHMMRVHGIFSSQNGKVLVHHCGRRYSPNWAGLTCNSPKSMCKDLVEGTAEWERHHVEPPSTQQEAADTFAYNDKNGLAPSALVVVGSSEEQFAAAVAAAATPAQVNNGPLAAGSSQDQAIAIVDDDEEDEQLPAAKRRRV